MEVWDQIGFGIVIVTEMLASGNPIRIRMRRQLPADFP
jgi:hypothetical protein